MPPVADVFALATQSFAEGNFSLAEQYSWSVITQESNHAESLHLLGLIAQRNGDLVLAIDYLNRSILSKGTDAFTWKNLGDLHFGVGDLRAGVANYEQALRLQPDFGEAYDHLGVALQNLGEWARAESCHREALRLMPSSAQVYHNLANALRGQEKMAEAASAFGQALALQPDNPESAYNLGTALHEQSKLDEAVGYYRQALRLKPENPNANNNLATAYKEQGLLDQAVAQFRETVKVQPDHALAYYNLSELAAVGQYSFAPDELERIQAIVACERYSATERSLCAFAVATVLNKQGSYDEAFGYYQKANLFGKRVQEERHRAFDAQNHEVFVDRIIDIHDRAYFEQVQEWGTDSDMPIFIIGMPRSGSTLVEQILASHPQVFGAGELGEIPRFMAKLAAETDAGDSTSPLLTSESAARNMAADYLKRLAALGQGAGLVTDKTLENFLHLGVIATLFPRARIIHCRRHPLDICLSCYFQNFQSVDFAWSLEDIGVYYLTYEKLMAHWARVLPLEIREVRYEDLVHDQETVTRDLLAFCGLEWDERCLTFWNTRRVVRTASTVQVRKPISRQAIGRWKHYRAHLEPLFQVLGAME